MLAKGISSHRILLCCTLAILVSLVFLSHRYTTFKYISSLSKTHMTATLINVPNQYTSITFARVMMLKCRWSSHSTYITRGYFQLTTELLDALHFTHLLQRHRTSVYAHFY